MPYWWKKQSGYISEELLKIQQRHVHPCLVTWKDALISKVTANICIRAQSSHQILRAFYFSRIHVFILPRLQLRLHNLCCLKSWNKFVLLFYRRCVMKRRNWFSVKSIVNNCWDVLRLLWCCSSTEVWLLRSQDHSGGKSAAYSERIQTHTQPLVLIENKGKHYNRKWICLLTSTCFCPSFAPFLSSCLGQCEFTKQGIIKCYLMQERPCFYFTEACSKYQGRRRKSWATGRLSLDGRKRTRCDLFQHPLDFTTATVLSVREPRSGHMSQHSRYGNDKRTDDSMWHMEIQQTDCRPTHTHTHTTELERHCETRWHWTTQTKTLWHNNTQQKHTPLQSMYKGGLDTHRYTLIIRNVLIRDKLVEVAELNWGHWEASCDFTEPITYRQNNCIL